MRESVWVAAGLLMSAACEREIFELKDSTAGPPVVERFSPSAGLAGQTVVRVEGRAYPADARVFFGTKQGVFAVGPDYQYSDTVVFAIAPLGTPDLVEIRVRGSTGEGESSQLFRVFDGDPEILEVSHPRVTPSSLLTIEGRNFNPDDAAVSLTLGGASVSSFEVEPERIVVDLRTVSDYGQVGTGWKLLRYRFTPFSEDGPSESTHPIYVTQEPQITSAEPWAASRGLLRVWIDGFDDYDPLDNRIWVDSAEAELLDYDYRDLDTTANEDRGRRVQVEALVALPELASGYHHVTVENLAGWSADHVGFDVVGAGELYGDATPGAEEPLSLEPVLHSTGNGVERLTTTITSPQESPFVPTGRLRHGELRSGGGNLLYESGIDGSAYPLTATVLQYSRLQHSELFVAALYSQQATTHTLELRYHYWDGVWGQCPLAAVTAPLPAGATLEAALERHRLTTDVFVVAPGKGVSEDAVVLLAVSGELWSGLYAYPMLVDDRAPGAACPPAVGALTRLADPSSLGATAIADIAYSPSQGLVYLLPASTAPTLGEIAALRIAGAPGADSLAVQPLRVTLDGAGDEQVTGCPETGRLMATRDGFIAIGSSSLCRFRTRYYPGVSAGLAPVFRVMLPYNLGGCSGDGRCAPVALSPNERELWLTDYYASTFPAAGRRLVRISALSGAGHEQLESLATGNIHTLFYDYQGTTLTALFVPADIGSLPAYSVATSFSQMELR